MTGEFVFNWEPNKGDLNRFKLKKENVFDTALDPAISLLKKDIEHSEECFYSIVDLEKNEPERYAELVEKTSYYDTSLETSQRETFYDILYCQEQLLSFLEMKVINSYRTLEINLKLLINAAYQPASVKEFDKWNNMVKYLLSKNIDVTNFSSYNNVIELKTVNNSIKHNGDYENELVAIPEFLIQNDFAHKKLEQFYERVKSSPIEFVEELITAIKNGLKTVVL